MRSTVGTRAGFLRFGTSDILGYIILRCETCPVHGRVVSGIPGFFDSLDVSHDYQVSSDTDKCPWGVGQNSYPVENQSVAFSILGSLRAEYR